MLQINKNPSPRELRQFGLFWFPLFGGVVGALLYWRAAAPGAAFAVWGAAAGLSAAGLLCLPLLRGLFVCLQYATFPIGWAVSHLLLTLAYFLVLTPVGLLLRLFGKDPLERGFDPGAKTYWVKREQPAGRERYFRQF